MSESSTESHVAPDGDNDKNVPLPATGPDRLINPRAAYDWTRISFELDGAGLPPIAFRVYCHFLRRSDKQDHTCFPGVNRIAADCLLDRKAVMRAIELLETHGFIGVDRSNGRRSDYKIYPKADWKPIPKFWKPVPLKDRSSKGTGTPKGLHQSLKGTATSTLKGHEANTEKLIQETKEIITAARAGSDPGRANNQKEVIDFALSDPECIELSITTADAKCFFNDMAAGGWRDKRGPLADWQALFRRYALMKWLPSQKKKPGARQSKRPIATDENGNTEAECAAKRDGRTLVEGY
jgi:Helix-turn-helix domain